MSEEKVTVKLLPDGPLVIQGSVNLITADGKSKETGKMTALCRCGASANKPYCDGAHIESGFKD